MKKLRNAEAKLKKIALLIKHNGKSKNPETLEIKKNCSKSENIHC